MRLGQSLLSSVLAASLLGMPIQAGADEITETGHTVKNILLISVDGMHALDLADYVATHPDSTLKSLSDHGVTYTNASTSRPSDSFPGLAAQLTGGLPPTTGLWYDVTYNRLLSPPRSATTPNGAPIPPCSVRGTQVAFDESDDFKLTLLDGGGGVDTDNLPLDPDNGCTPVFPHQYLRVNTIFNVFHNHGLRTAWTDKHPSYEWTGGPHANGVDDFYGPEINSIPVALPQYAGCSPVPFPDPTPDDGWTTDFRNIICYDSLHVTAVLNQIDGFTHDRSARPGVPAVFGTNFQAVSVGEKLPAGGYTDVLGTPSEGLASELDFVDKSLGKFVAELKKQGIYDSTLIIVSAKHGQSPIDRSKRKAIAGGLPQAIIGSNYAFDISDDASLIWLQDNSNFQVEQTVKTLSENQDALGIQEIFALQSLRLAFNNSEQDAHTPDIVLKVNTGVIFTGGSKIAEHGGVNEDDLHVALLVSLPGMEKKSIKVPVNTTQIAPTIVKVFGFDPNELQAVQEEQTPVLPFLFTEEREQN